MKVINLAPKELVAEYVERILVIEDYQITRPFSLPLFANGSPTLVFNSVSGVIKNDPTTHLTLFGQTILPEMLTFTESFTLIAYFIKPYALVPIFGVTAPELTDRPVDLNLLISKKHSRLQEQLLNAASTEERIALIDNFIAGVMAGSSIDCRILKYATTRIANNASADFLSWVQKDLYITPRTFQRMFEKNIGISPNLYRRICQFHAAFQQLNSRRFHKLSDIALRNGYADQSHYIRSFKEFTNITPKDYLNFEPEP